MTKQNNTKCLDAHAVRGLAFTSAFAIAFTVGCAAPGAQPTFEEQVGGLEDSLGAFFALPGPQTLTLESSPEGGRGRPYAILPMGEFDLLIEVDTTPDDDDEGAASELVFTPSSLEHLDGVLEGVPVTVDAAGAAHQMVHGDALCQSARLQGLTPVSIDGHTIDAMLFFHLTASGGSGPSEQSSALYVENPAACGTRWNAVPFYRRFWECPATGSPCTGIIPNKGMRQGSVSVNVADRSGSASGSTSHEGPFVTVTGSCGTYRGWTSDSCTCVIPYVDPR